MRQGAGAKSTRGLGAHTAKVANGCGVREGQLLHRRGLRKRESGNEDIAMSRKKELIDTPRRRCSTLWEEVLAPKKTKGVRSRFRITTVAKRMDATDRAGAAA